MTEQTEREQLEEYRIIRGSNTTWRLQRKSRTRAPWRTVALYRGKDEAEEACLHYCAARDAALARE